MSAAPPPLDFDRILLLRLSSIGDVIHAIPAFAALRAARPDAEIGWAVERAAAPLVRALPGLDRVHELDIQSWRGGMLKAATWGAVSATLRDLRSHSYQVAIDLQGLWKSAVLARLSGARTLGLATVDLREPGVRHLYHRQAAAAPAGHITGRGLGLVRALGLPCDPTPQWPPLHRDEDDRYVDDRLKSIPATRPVLIHSAANWSSKHYPDAAWVEIGRGIRAATDRPVLWLRGPGELDRVTRLALAAGDGNHPCFPTELPQLAALMRRASVVLGGDSAPLHLAVACGAPVVGLFGPTDPERLGPVDSADGVVVRRLECSHCHRRTCPLGTNECLESISPEEVVRAVTARLGSGRGMKGDACD